MKVKAKNTESKELKRLRKRLAKRLSEQDKRITPEAIKQMTALIKVITERKTSSIVDLKKRRITTYDHKSHSKDRKSTGKLKDFIKRDYFL